MPRWLGCGRIFVAHLSVVSSAVQAKAEGAGFAFVIIQAIAAAYNAQVLLACLTCEDDVDVIRRLAFGAFLIYHLFLLHRCFAACLIICEVVVLHRVGQHILPESDVLG